MFLFSLAIYFIYNVMLLKLMILNGCFGRSFDDVICAICEGEVVALASSAGIAEIEQT